MDSVAATPDESTFDIPKRWRPRLLHPRRGGLEVPAAEPDAGAAGTIRKVVGASTSWIEEVLDGPDSDPELVTSARRHLDGDADPLGAAVVAMAVLWCPGADWGSDHGERHHQLMDAWIAEHGLPFAACAVVELSRLHLDRPPSRHPGPSQGFEETGQSPSIRFDESGDLVWWYVRTVLSRMRSLLARAGDDDYEGAERRLAALRRTPEESAAVSYLLPTRRDWVDECCAAPPSGDAVMWQLLCAVTSVEQLDRLGMRTRLPWGGQEPDVFTTLAEGVGPAIAPALSGLLDEPHLRVKPRRDVLNILGVLPSDEAFGLLVSRLGEKGVEPAVTAAAKRFPVRALRVLAAAAAAGEGKAARLAADLLRSHAATVPALAAAELPGLPPESRAVAEHAVRASGRVAEAPMDVLPRLLTDPPWTRKGRAGKAVVIGGLVPAQQSAMCWLPGEREEFLALDRESGRGGARDTDWEGVVARYRAGGERLSPAEVALGPEELMRPLLADWAPGTYGAVEWWLPRLVARFELDMLPVALRTGPARYGPDALQPVLDEGVALLMADRLVRLKRARPSALAWFGRHGIGAARMLFPVALGKPGARRRAAEAALLHLASELGAAEIVQAARAHGPEAADAIGALLASDPVELLDVRPPKVGDWAVPALLPQVILRGGGRALPSAATGHLIALLAMPAPGGRYPGLDAVKEVCDPGSLAAFSWAVFERWQAAGSPSRDGWALEQLGRLGDDEAARRLAPLIRAWPRESAHGKAVAGLDVLAGIGTDVALLHLHGIAQKVRFPVLRARAQEKVGQVAAALGLTPEQLADRLVPDFGLDPGGSMVLDYGPRGFTVGFDEQLRPYVHSADGKRRPSPPKPAAKDDAALATASYRRFAALRKDVRTVAADRIERLEQAMVGRHRWTAAEFRRLFASHPLLRHIARRLVWVSEADGGAAAAFRVAEDGTLAGMDDDVFDLPDAAQVGVVHPIGLGGDLTAWGQIFADYEILQPFPQLGREVHALTEDELRDGHLARFEGISVPVGGILGLERRGWEREEPGDAGIQMSISRPLPGGGEVSIVLDPPIAVGAPGRYARHTLESVWFSVRAALHPVDASEMLGDLAAVAGRSAEPS